MLLKGFRFGMLLQLAVGPVFIFIFRTASAEGFYGAEAGVLGVILTDGLFILAAILGIASIIEKKNIRTLLKIAGSAILLVFGAGMALGAFGVRMLPSIEITGFRGMNGSFVYAVLLTASNPLTILFWAGVFSAKIVEDGIDRKDMYVFGCGALLSTAAFLTLTALAGSVIQLFLTPAAMQAMNLIVGLSLIYFAVKMLFRKQA